MFSKWRHDNLEKKYGIEVADKYWPDFKLLKDLVILENRRNEILD